MLLVASRLLVVSYDKGCHIIIFCSNPSAVGTVCSDEPQIRRVVGQRCSLIILICRGLKKAGIYVVFSAFLN